jgi:hypothetical protein
MPHNQCGSGVKSSLGQAKVLVCFVTPKELPTNQTKAFQIEAVDTEFWWGEPLIAERVYS